MTVFRGRQYQFPPPVCTDYRRSKAPSTCLSSTRSQGSVSAWPTAVGDEVEASQFAMADAIDAALDETGNGPP